MEGEAGHIQSLREKGYTEDFTTTPSYTFLVNAKRIYKPYEFRITSYYKFQGSGKGENFILFAIETIDGKKGILRDSCGDDGEEKISKFIHAVTAARLFCKRHRFFSVIQNLFRYRFSFHH